MSSPSGKGVPRLGQASSTSRPAARWASSRTPSSASEVQPAPCNRPGDPQNTGSLTGAASDESDSDPEPVEQQPLNYETAVSNGQKLQQVYLERASKAEATLIGVKRQLKQLKKQPAKLHKDSKEMAGRLLSKITKEDKEAQQAAQLAAERLASLQQKKEELTGDKTEALSTLGTTTDLRVVLERLHAELEAAKQKIQALEQQVQQRKEAQAKQQAELQAQVAALTQQLQEGSSAASAAFQAEQESLQEQLAAMASAHKAALVKVEADLAGSKAALDVAQKAAAAAGEEVMQLKEQVTAQASTRQQLSSQLAEASTHTGALQATVDRLQREVNGHVAAAAAASERHSKQLQECRSEVPQLQRRLRDATAELETARATASRDAAALNKAQADVAAIRDEHSKLEKQLQAAQEAAKAAEARAAAAQAEAAAAMAKAAAADKQAAAAEKRASAAEGEAAAARTAQVAEQGANSKLEKQLQSAQEATKAAEAKAAAAQAEAAAAMAKAKAADKQVAAAEKRASAAEGEAAAAKTAQVAEQGANSELEKQLQAAQEAVKAAEARAAAAEERAVEARTTQGAALLEVAQLKRDLQAKSQQLADVVQERATVASELLTLQQAGYVQALEREEVHGRENALYTNWIEALGALHKPDLQKQMERNMKQQQELNAAQLELDLKGNRIATLEQQVQALTAQLPADPALAAAGDASITRWKFRECNVHLAALRTKFDQRESEMLKNAKAQLVADVEHTQKHWARKHNHVEDSFKAAEKKKVELQQQNQRLSGTVANLQHHNERLGSTVADLQQQNQRMSSTVANVQQQLIAARQPAWQQQQQQQQQQHGYAPVQGMAQYPLPHFQQQQQQQQQHMYQGNGRQWGQQGRR